MPDWNLISYVMASKPRLRVYLELTKRKMTPSGLAEELDIPISHVSKALSELSEERVIECLTPERRKKKFYEATEKGHSLKNQIKELIRDGK